MQCRREKTERSADLSFPYWQSLSPGDPSVTFGDSSPKRGAKGEASPFRGKYLEEGMGAPGRDMEQGLPL